MALPLYNRLKKEKDFQRTLKTGRTIKGAVCGIRYKENGDVASRFGFSISLRVSKKAAERNRIKRVLSEAVRKELQNIKPGYDVVVSVFPGAVECENEDLRRGLFSLLKKIGISTNAK